MFQCSKCLENNWSLSAVTAIIVATCKNCGAEKSFPARGTKSLKRPKPACFLRPIECPPSPSEVESGRSPAGGWTRATLQRWGVPWPPPGGWRKELHRQWSAKNPDAVPPAPAAYAGYDQVGEPPW
jgi:hypothetical protein